MADKEHRCVPSCQAGRSLTKVKGEKGAGYSAQRGIDDYSLLANDFDLGVYRLTGY